MTENRFNFTKKVLDALATPPKGKRTYYYDAKTRGLGISVTSTGAKTFVVYRKIQGRPERITLGRYPDLAIEQARGLAAEANAAIARGENPNEKKRAVREEMTLGELFSLYLERHAKVHKRSWRDDQAQFERFLGSMAHRKISNVRKANIQILHAKVGRDHGLYAANRVLALLHTLFNKAREWGWEKSNPAGGIRKFKERQRDRFLQTDELPRFFRALAGEPNTTVRDYIVTSLLTGARRTNVLEMRWDNISFERQEWRIPNTKDGTAYTVPLMPKLVAILEQRRVVSTSEYVFPGPGTTGHLVEPRKAWKRILNRAEIKDLRIHDLRRSLGSWQATTGANLSVIGKTLNHKNVTTTAIYARLNLDPVREAMQKATTAMLTAGELLDDKQSDHLQEKALGSNHD